MHLPQPVGKDKYTFVHLLKEFPYPALDALPIYPILFNAHILRSLYCYYFMLSTAKIQTIFRNVFIPCKNHIVKSMKGSQGGYFLERDPKEITVAQIVEALEGTYDLEDEVDRNSVGRGDQEAIQHLIIDRINDCVQEILEDVTLKDLVDAYEGYQDSVEGMYYI